LEAYIRSLGILAALRKYIVKEAENELLTKWNGGNKDYQGYRALANSTSQ
jgi:hypothetical protein